MTMQISERLRKDAQLRAARYVPDTQLSVNARTLGTSVGFYFNTRNISKSGLLIEQSQPGRIPFLVNTLIEISIDEGSNWLEKPVECIAKVVRIVPTEAEETKSADQYGIRIVQIEKVDGDLWEKSIDLLAKKLGFSPEPIFPNAPKKLAS